MMNIVLACKNLMDLSRLVSTFDAAGAKTTKYKDLASAFSALENETPTTFFVDFYLLADTGDIEHACAELAEKAKSFGDRVQCTVFGSHEKMRELSGTYDSVAFVARSQFFRDPASFI